MVYFRPSNPDTLDDEWFSHTKDWYDKKERGLIEGQPISFHYWAVDGEKIIGEFQLRTEFPEKEMLDIGSIGYAVRVSEQGKGYGTEIIRQGLVIAKEHGMEKVLLTINDKNMASIRMCEKMGGKLMDTIEAYNDAEVLKGQAVDIHPISRMLSQNMSVFITDVRVCQVKCVNFFDFFRRSIHGRRYLSIDFA